MAPQTVPVLRSIAAVPYLLVISRQTCLPAARHELRAGRPRIPTSSQPLGTQPLYPGFPCSSLSSWQLHQHQPVFSRAACSLHTRPLHRQAGNTLWQQLHTVSRRQLSQTWHSTEQQPGIKAQLPKPIANLQQRAVGYLRESLLLSYSALFDNVIFRVAEWLRLDKLFQWMTPGLENGYAAITGD